MEADYIQIGLAISGLILTNITVKAARIYPLLKKAFELIRNEEEAKKDGKLSPIEKAKLYDNIVALNKEAWALLSGLWPNKSKVK